MVPVRFRSRIVLRFGMINVGPCHFHNGNRFVAILDYVCDLPESINLRFDVSSRMLDGDGSLLVRARIARDSARS